MSNTKLRSSITLIYYKFNILKINELYKLETAKIMYQHSINLLPSCFFIFFHNVNSGHNRNTRSQTLNTLHPPKYSTLRTQKSLKFPGTKIWNAISPELRNQSYNNFKTQFKKQLLEGYNS